MHKKQLQHIKHHVQAALSDMNWQGMFNEQIRTATVEHRTRTHNHLVTALEALDTELKRCDKRIQRRREKDAKRSNETAQYRAPYKDD